MQRTSDEPTDTVAVGAGEIFLQAAAAPGLDPFFDEPSLVDEIATSDVVDQRAVQTTPTSALPDPVATLTVIGTEPGLYGGTQDNAACNVEAQIGFLQANPEKADAWADAQGIDSKDLPDYLRNLTPVVLLDDTRVTNHGFRNGRARPFQSVLEAGTAVLIDENGVPRSRCACGNPLAAPIARTSVVTYRGDTWPTFTPDDVAVVAPGQPVDDFVLVDVEDGEPFVRESGSDGSEDEPAPAGALDDRSAVAPLVIGDSVEVASSSSSTEPSGDEPATTEPSSGAEQADASATESTEAPADPTDASSSTTAAQETSTTVGDTTTTAAPATTTTTAAPAATTTTTTAAPTTTTTTAPSTTTTAAPSVGNITELGAVSASSVFNGSFATSLAVDGSQATSWFSAGPTGGVTTFTWTASSDIFLSSLVIVGNANHSNPGFRTGFGFEGVTVDFLDGSGTVIASIESNLAGTPDPTVTVTFDHIVRGVRLTFTGSEADDCGGFSELTINGYAV